jgi:ribosomal protein S18 acetylase RimI-like enzyme
MISFMDDLPDESFYIRAIAVHPDHRGKGVGRRLMVHMIDAARAGGSRHFVLDVAAKNRDGRRFYESLGMSRDGESRRWFGLPNTNLFRMKLDL